MAIFKNKSVVKVLFVLLALAPIIGWILPGDFMDHGEMILCPSRLFFDIECFGCGMSRAVLHFHNFEFSDAVFYNSLVILVYPGLVYVWGRWMYFLYKRSFAIPSNT